MEKKENKKVKAVLLSDEQMEWIQDAAKDIFMAFFEQRPVTNESQLLNVSKFSVRIAFQLFFDVMDFDYEKILHDSSDIRKLGSKPSLVIR